tara:strand:- start:2695 stop:3204 length:510 start_codon:yes stop_codon:yes gene_type:complete
VVRKYIDSIGRVSLENGDTVSPPVAGYSNGNDRIVEVVAVTVDNSTTALTEKAVVEVVEDNRVLRTATISDVSIEEVRVGTSIDKGAFCLGLISLGIIEADEAISAARGNWPASMDTFLSYISADQAIAVQIEWATETTINRNNVFVLTLGSWLDNITPEILDTLFGIG